jgi:hypothetical protein
MAAIVEDVGTSGRCLRRAPGGRERLGERVGWVVIRAPASAQTCFEV